MKKISVTHIWKEFDTYNGMVEILLYLSRYYDKKILNFGACVYNDNGSIYAEMFKKKGGELYNLQCKSGIKGHILFFIKLIRFFKKHKPDIVVTHDRRCNLFGISAAKIAKIPIIISMEDTLGDSATTWIKRLRDRAFHPILKTLVWSSCDAFVSSSESIRRQWIRKSCPSKFKVIYPPFNLEKYEAVTRNPKNNRSNDGFPILGYVGRLSEEKGLQYLISALPEVRKKFPNLKLLVAGIGELGEFFKSLAKEKEVDDCVLFLGFQENQFKVYEKIDLFILPSRTEGCPIVVVEAMAMGVPVIASNVGGTSELVSDDVGVLIPAKNVKALSTAIISLISKPQKLGEMGKAGKKRAFTHFHPLNFVRKLEEIYIELSEKKLKMSWLRAQH